MSLIKNNVILWTAAVLAAAVSSVYSTDEPEIDISRLKQSNPFVQFAGTGQAAAVSSDKGPKPELVVEKAVLKFLDAKSLKSSISNMSGEWGNMEPDSKGNSLIICDTKENVEKILTQIRKVDAKPRQIMIEVVILDVKLGDDTEIGVNWDMLTNTYRDVVFRQNLGFTNRLGATVSDATTTGDATAWNTTGSGSDFSLLSGDIRNVIHMLQKKNDVEILASPKVLVVSGQNAFISAAEEIPYEETSNTSQGGSLTSTQFKDVGVKLTVGATITDDNDILLAVESEQKVNTGTSGVNNVPIVDARKIQSSLLLQDGQIVVIGGLRRKQVQEQARQLPFLGDLPVVGFAFRATNSVENYSELLVMISPHIHRGEKPDEAQMTKFNDISRQPLLMTKKEQKEKEETAKKEAEKAGKEAKKRAKTSAKAD